MFARWKFAICSWIKTCYRLQNAKTVIVRPYYLRWCPFSSKVCYAYPETSRTSRLNLDRPDSRKITLNRFPWFFSWIILFLVSSIFDWLFSQLFAIQRITFRFVAYLSWTFTGCAYSTYNILLIPHFRCWRHLCAVAHIVEPKKTFFHAHPAHCKKLASARGVLLVV